jgi:hypothetical protein
VAGCFIAIQKDNSINKDKESLNIPRGLYTW